MNKISILAIGAAMTLGLASCDEYTLPNPPAQSNEPEAIFDAATLTVTADVPADLNFPAMAEAGQRIELATAQVSGLPENSTLSFVLEISGTEDFAKKADVATSYAQNGKVYANVTDVQPAITEVITRNVLEPVTVYGRLKAYVVGINDVNNDARIGGPDVYYGAFNTSVMPVLLTHEIAAEYYLIGSFCDWNVAGAIKMTKLQGGNQYDYPDFFVSFTVDADQVKDGYKWQVVPASVIETGTWNGAYYGVPEAEDANKGTLVAAADAESGAGEITEPGSYKLSVNMYDLTYEVSLAYDYLYVKAQGYYQDARMLRLYTNDYVHYDGFTRINRSFNLLCQPSIAEGVGYGPDGETTKDENGVETGKLAITTDLVAMKAIELDGRGYFYLEANLGENTFKASPINTISIIGNYNEWNLETAKDLTVTKTVIWTVKDIELKDEFKFCVNHGWTLSFGGSYDNIYQNGGNLTVPEPGKYDVTLDFSTVPPSCKLEKK